MRAQADGPSSGPQESVDLAALGRMYKPPPQQMDTSPEVSDVIAKMPWWAARGLLYIIVSFAIVALVWASLSTVDVVTEARGTLVPEGYVKAVKATDAGVVQNVLVKEGETVERGQPIVELEATPVRARLDKLREELETSQSQLRPSIINRPEAETLEQQNRVARLQSEIAAAELSLQRTTITAPVSGVITTLDVDGTGAVLKEGETIANIFPAEARLVVEAQVPNRDIAFIEKGLPVKLKFDAFPFQDYGIVNGTVIEVAPDAQQGKGVQADSDSASFYKVMIAPKQTSMAVQGKTIPLKLGLTLTAEIVTERRSILNLVLEPFRKLRSEAGNAK